MLKKISAPKKILYLFILINLTIGIFIAPDYGQSTDEPIEYRNSQLAKLFFLYSFDGNPFKSYENLGLAQYYGTASQVIIRFIEPIFQDPSESAKMVVAHYSYFVFFQASVLFLFLLAKQFLDDWTALGITLIFGTQPLLFGQGFINPKDIPLMTVFLISVVTGFQMVDGWTNSLPTNVDLSQVNASVLKDLPSQNKKRKQRFLLILASIFTLLWLRDFISLPFLKLVEYAYNTKGSSMLGRLFAQLTTYGSLEGYLSLTKIYILKIIYWIILATPVLMIFLFHRAQKNQTFGKYIGVNLLLAAAVWGFAVSTRVVAIAAGGLVGIYALSKLKQKAIFPLVIYTITASIFSYVTWPYLWFYGLKGMFKALKTFSNFGHHGSVLFEGFLYRPIDLPPRYLPKLMLFQFTEPLEILAIVGFVIGLYLIIKKKTNKTKVLLLYAWFFLPLTYASLRDIANYSNFRQYLFTIPPLFIFAGLAIQQITIRLKQKSWILLVCLILILPGIFSIIQLHPFQYIYYNEFTGGVEGAFRQYELDYWLISYKDVMDYVNENIPAGSKILVWVSGERARIYAEKKYVFGTHRHIPEEEYIHYDYAIIPTRRLYDQLNFVDAPVIYSVKVDNADLMLVKVIPKHSD